MACGSANQRKVADMHLLIFKIGLRTSATLRIQKQSLLIESFHVIKLITNKVYNKKVIHNKVQKSVKTSLRINFVTYNL